jgi:hypothetical protein
MMMLQKKTYVISCFKNCALKLEQETSYNEFEVNDFMRWQNDSFERNYEIRELVAQIGRIMRTIYIMEFEGIW